MFLTGKISLRAKPVKIFADATLVFPLLVAETFFRHFRSLKTPTTTTTLTTTPKTKTTTTTSMPDPPAAVADAPTHVVWQKIYAQKIKTEPDTLFYECFDLPQNDDDDDN